MLRSIEKPATEEYPPYAEMYMKLLSGDGQVLQHFKENFIVKKLIYSLPEENYIIAMRWVSGGSRLRFCY